MFALPEIWMAWIFHTNEVWQPTIIVVHASKIIERPNKVNSSLEVNHVLFINQRRLKYLSESTLFPHRPQKAAELFDAEQWKQLILSVKLNLKCMFTLQTLCQFRLRNIPSNLSRQKKVLSSLNKLGEKVSRKAYQKVFSFALGTSFNCVWMLLNWKMDGKVFRAAYARFENRLKMCRIAPN